MSHKKKVGEPQIFKRPDWAIDQDIGDDYALEDVCKHGVGHPNREYLDSLPEDEARLMGIHTCCGCCSGKNQDKWQAKSFTAMRCPACKCEIEPVCPVCSSKDTIECEEEEDGSLTLGIPDDLVQKIVQSFMENALYELAKENQKLSKEIK